MNKNAEVISFLIQEKYIENLNWKIFPVYSGAASDNFILKYNKKYCFCKLLHTQEKAEILIQNHKKMDECSICPKILFPVFNFKGTKGLLLEYKNGKILNPRKLNESYCQLVLKNYKIFSKILNKNHIKSSILPKLDLNTIKNVVIQRLNQQCFGTKKYFIRQIKNYLTKIQSQIILHKEEQLQIIHGDFTTRNILIDKNKNISIIDLEEFRFGYPTEDFSRFIFCAMERGGNVFKRKKILKNNLRFFRKNLPYTNNEWLLGYYAFLLQKLYKVTEKKLTLIKSIKIYLLIKLIKDITELDNIFV